VMPAHCTEYILVSPPDATIAVTCTYTYIFMEVSMLIIYTIRGLTIFHIKLSEKVQTA
jgi:hypothetical protein